MNTLHFSENEIICPCCGFYIKNKDTLNQLYMTEKARTRAGIPFHMNSWFRCYKHNAIVGGSKTSSHLLGLAGDVLVGNDTNRFTIVEALLFVGFKRILIYKTFIHFDSDKNKRQNIIKLIY